MYGLELFGCFEREHFSFLQDKFMRNMKEEEEEDYASVHRDILQYCVPYISVWDWACVPLSWQC